MNRNDDKSDWRVGMDTMASSSSPSSSSSLSSTDTNPILTSVTSRLTARQKGPASARPTSTITATKRPSIFECEMPLSGNQTVPVFNFSNDSSSHLFQSVSTELIKVHNHIHGKCAYISFARMLYKIAMFQKREDIIL